MMKSTKLLAFMLLVCLLLTCTSCNIFNTDTSTTTDAPDTTTSPSSDTNDIDDGSSVNVIMLNDNHGILIEDNWNLDKIASGINYYDSIGETIKIANISEDEKKAQIEEVKKQLNEKRAQADELRKANFKKFEAVLTDKQKAELEKIKEENRQEFKKHKCTHRHHHKGDCRDKKNDCGCHKPVKQDCGCSLKDIPEKK